MGSQLGFAALILPSSVLISWLFTTRMSERRFNRFAMRPRGGVRYRPVLSKAASDTPLAGDLNNSSLSFW
jgi:hypothetical protein